MSNIDVREIMTKLIDTHGESVLAALVIVALGYLAARLAGALVRQLLEADEIVASFLSRLTRLLVVFLAIVAAIDELGVHTTPISAIVAAFGLGASLALKDFLSDLAAGFLLVVSRRFEAGDFVEAAGVSGVVESMSMFATTMRTPDNREIVVPNGSITGSTVVNYSARKKRRIDLIVGIGYDDDLAKAKEVLRAVLAGDERVLDDPAPAVAVAELADSSVNLMVRPWVKTSDYGSVKRGLLEKIKLELDAHGISIPYPQQDLHLHTPEAESPKAA